MLDKHEGARAVDIVLMPIVAVGLHVLLAVNPIERGSHRWQESTRGKFQIEDHRLIVRRIDGVDHLEERLTYTLRAFGGDLPACRK